MERRSLRFRKGVSQVGLRREGSTVGNGNHYYAVKTFFPLQDIYRIRCRYLGSACHVRMNTTAVANDVHTHASTSHIPIRSCDLETVETERLPRRCDRLLESIVNFRDWIGLDSICR